MSNNIWCRVELLTGKVYRVNSTFCVTFNGVLTVSCSASYFLKIFLIPYLPPANEVWGKVIFSQAFVKNSVHRDGVPGPGGLLRGCLLRGVLLPGGVCFRGGVNPECCTSILLTVIPRVTQECYNSCLPDVILSHTQVVHINLSCSDPHKSF